jgi:hypothetical protein
MYECPTLVVAEIVCGGDRILDSAMQLASKAVCAVSAVCNHLLASLVCITFVPSSISMCERVPIALVISKCCLMLRIPYLANCI